MVGPGVVGEEVGDTEGEVVGSEVVGDTDGDSVGLEVQPAHVNAHCWKVSGSLHADGAAPKMLTHAPSESTLLRELHGVGTPIGDVVGDWLGAGVGAGVGELVGLGVTGAADGDSVHPAHVDSHTLRMPGESQVKVPVLPAR